MVEAGRVSAEGGYSFATVVDRLLFVGVSQSKLSPGLLLTELYQTIRSLPLQLIYSPNSRFKQDLKLVGTSSRKIVLVQSYPE